MSVRAYIGVGANLGDREQTIRGAIAALDDHPDVRVGAVSRLIETEAVGAPGPDYLNGAFAVDTTLAARALLELLIETERSAGRERDVRWAPRTLDLDLLLYGDDEIDAHGISVPHPRMAERPFVLEPLAEIAPDVLVPGSGVTVVELLEALRDRAAGSMTRFGSVAEAAFACRDLREGGVTLGFVPTMGALHDGHIALVRASVERDDLTVVSIFVNPLQFDDPKDLERYPRDFDGDCAKLEAAGAGIVFTPTPEQMYPDGFRTHVEVEGMTDGLCGAHRPGHFRGVTTVVAKLFNIVRPERAYFGAKDYQQAAVLRRMARDLDTGIEVVVCPTVREPDGLAMSSRNVRLSPDGREQALALSRGLAAAADEYDRGTRDGCALVAAATAVLEGTDGVRPEYVELIDADSLAPIERVERPAVLAIAAWVDGVRLIDNRTLGG